MVTTTTLGGRPKERISRRVCLALSKGICTCMTTTSGSSSRASLRASASLGTSATTSMPPPWEASKAARPCLNMVWSSASSTLMIGSLGFADPTIRFPLGDEAWCAV